MKRLIISAFIVTMLACTCAFGTAWSNEMYGSGRNEMYGIWGDGNGTGTGDANIPSTVYSSDGASGTTPLYVPPLGDANGPMCRDADGNWAPCTAQEITDVIGDVAATLDANSNVIIGDMNVVRDINVGNTLRYFNSKTGNVIKVDSNGVTTPYIESADTATARGTAFLAALAASQAGDKIYINGDFNTNTTQVVHPNDVKVYGGGNASIETHVVAAIQYLMGDLAKIDGVTFWIPAGVRYITPATACRAYIENCSVYGDADLLYQTYAGSSFYLYRSNFKSNYDCHNSIVTCYLYADDCNFVSESNDADTAGSLRAIAGSSGGTFTADIRNSRLIARNLETSGTPTEVLGAYVNTGTITLRNCTVQAVSTQTPATKYDVQAATGSSIIASNTNGSGTNGSLITSGTITYADNGRFQQTLNYAANTLTSSNTFTNDVNITPSKERGLVVGSVPTPLATGTVDLNNIKLSLIDVNAFVDFNTASVLTGYVGNYLIIKDSQGRAVAGKIASAGSGETYGAELLANPTFDTATTGWSGIRATLSKSGGGYSNDCLKVAKLSGSSQGAYVTVGVTTAVGALYRAGIYVDSNTSGSNSPFYLQFGSNSYLESLNGISSASWVFYSLYNTTPTTTANFNIYKNDANTGNMLFDEATAKQVTAPSATGVFVTAPWRQNSAFDMADTNGYTYAIYDRPIGDLRVAGLADFNELTVTGKITLTPATAPTKTASAPTFSKFYGGDSNALGDPCTWVAVDANVGGTIKTLYMPLYGQP